MSEQNIILKKKLPPEKSRYNLVANCTAFIACALTIGAMLLPIVVAGALAIGLGIAIAFVVGIATVAIVKRNPYKNSQYILITESDKEKKYTRQVLVVAFLIITPLIILGVVMTAAATAGIVTLGAIAGPGILMIGLVVPLIIMSLARHNPYRIDPNSQGTLVNTINNNVTKGNINTEQTYDKVNKNTNGNENENENKSNITPTANDE